MATAHTIDLSHERTRLDELAPRLITLFGAIGVIGVAASVVLAWIETSQATSAAASNELFGRALKSYLQNFVFVVSLGLGGFFFTFLQHATKAGWSVAVRRPAEAVAANLMWLWVLFIPIAALFFMKGHEASLFPWADPATMNPDEAHNLEKKAGYLNVGFFLGRTGFYFLVWGVLSWFYFKNSVRQDHTGDPRLTSKMTKWSYLTAILFGVTATFASIDWMMSLSPTWFSTMFGVYFFAGLCTGFFALNILIFSYLQAQGRLTRVVNAEHFQDLGKLLFAFGIVFWAYIAYSQYMLIWYANLPAETAWFMPRYIHGWAILSWVLLIGHFVVPFLFMLSKHVKRATPLVVFGAVWMLALHWLDLYWLVMPVVPHQIHDTEIHTLSQLASVTTPADVNYGWKLYDFTWLIGLLGLFLAMTVYRLRDKELLPVRDPRLHESLAFENM